MTAISIATKQDLNNLFDRLSKRCEKVDKRFDYQDGQIKGLGTDVNSSRYDAHQLHIGMIRTQGCLKFANY